MAGKDDIAYMDKEKDARLELANEAGTEANETSRVTSGQLLLIAGAILTFSSSVMSNTNSIKHLSHGWKIALISSWVVFAVSALASILSLLSDYFFFKKWHDYQFAVGLSIHDGLDPDAAADKHKSQKPSGASPIWPLIVQSLLIFSGITLFIIVIAHMLLSGS
jgi:uncharacterized membrane protein SirB2